MLGLLRVGLCTAAYKLARWVPATAGGTSTGARLECHSFGLAVLAATAGNRRGSEPSESMARARFGRADGVSELRLGCRSQQEASDPEKPPGCVPGGGRGSSSPAGNRAGAKRRRARAVHETARNGSVEGHLLAEGALGRRSRRSSRGGGGGGLGLTGRAVFASGSGEVTRASERGAASTQDGEQPSFVRGDAERSGPRGVNSSILRRETRRGPSGARVLVFEMWIAEAGQTHLWSAIADLRVSSRTA